MRDVRDRVKDQILSSVDPGMSAANQATKSLVGREVYHKVKPRMIPMLDAMGDHVFHKVRWRGFSEVRWSSLK